MRSPEAKRGDAIQPSRIRTRAIAYFFWKANALPPSKLVVATSCGVGDSTQGRHAVEAFLLVMPGFR